MARQAPRRLGNREKVYVRGTKNIWRSRAVIVEDWAWPFLRRAFADKLPDALVFDGLDYESARKAHRAALTQQPNCVQTTRVHDSRHSIAVRWMKQGSSHRSSLPTSAIATRPSS